MTKKVSTRVDPMSDVIASGRRIYAAIEAVDQAIATQLGIHRSDLRALNVLKDGPLLPRDIAECTALTSGSVTALIDRLECAGYVQRQPSQTDRRSIEIVITPEKFSLICDLYSQCATNLKECFGKQNARQLKASLGALGEFAEAMEVAAETIGKIKKGDA